MKKHTINTRKICFCAVISALALVAFVLEQLLPPLFLPGAKLGISNVFVLFAIFYLGKEYGFAVFLVKVLLGSVFSGNVSALIYSLPSGLLAVATEMLLSCRDKWFSVTAISVLAGVIHLLSQNVIFCLIYTSYEYLYFLPYFMLIGVLSGAVVGVIVSLALKYIPARIIECEKNKTEDIN